jgi:hypothetical protein
MSFITKFVQVLLIVLNMAFLGLGIFVAILGANQLSQSKLAYGTIARTTAIGKFWA